MPGPPPKPPELRRRTNLPLANTVKLPAGGRKGPAPAWPLSTRPTPAESALWGQLWATPAAAAWERLAWTRIVARYAVVLLAAEEGSSAPLLGEVRQLEDRLGLSPMAMLRLRWEVVEEEPDAPSPSSRSSRRLRAVQAVDGPPQDVPPTGRGA